MMNKKILLILAALMLWGIHLHAQQDAMYTQYRTNMMSVNPAYAGSKKALNIIALSRHQWVGFEGAPQTQTLAVNTPFLGKDLGLGFTYVRDQIGPLNVDNIFLDVAYKVKVHEGGHLSMGVKGGIDVRKNNLTELNPLNGSDPSYQQNLISNVAPNFGAGLYYFTDQYYLGVSTPKIAKTDYRQDENPNLGSTELERHYFIIGGYVWDIHERVKFKPAVLSKLVQNAPPSFDISANFMYDDRFVGGISHRIGDSFSAILQVRAMPVLWVGYAYDQTITELNRFNGGTHEIMINLDLNLPKQDIVKSPRFF